MFIQLSFWPERALFIMLNVSRNQGCTDWAHFSNPLPGLYNHWWVQRSEIRRESYGNNQEKTKRTRLTWWRRSGLSSGFQRPASLSGPLPSLALASFASCGERRWWPRHSVWAAAAGLSSGKRWTQRRTGEQRGEKNSAQQILGDVLKDRHGRLHLH